MTLDINLNNQSSWDNIDSTEASISFQSAHQLYMWQLVAASVALAIPVLWFDPCPVASRERPARASAIIPD